MKTLTLEPQTEVNRNVSIAEYYHAAVGSSKRTMELPRISVMIIECENRIAPERWEAALQRAADANPATRIKMIGYRQKSRWTSNGARYPALRVVQNCTWDGRSQEGSEFIDATPLDLRTGPVVELVVAKGKKDFVVLRVSHSVMDGMGMLHFLREVFRALRDEPLLGSNAAFSDVDLMLATEAPPWQAGAKGAPIPLTGSAQGTDLGDVWRRLTLPLKPQKNLLGRLAELCANYARNFNDGLVRFAVPVNLRKHYPGLVSTSNFTGLIHIDMDKTDDAESFRHKLRQALDDKRDVVYHWLVRLLIYMPMSWIDYGSGRRKNNYLNRRVDETVLITNFGSVDLNDFFCPDFTAHNVYSVPLAGNAFISLYASGENINVMVGMPKVYASGGRMEEFCEMVERMLS